jgi:hypothetical protein
MHNRPPFSSGLGRPGNVHLLAREVDCFEPQLAWYRRAPGYGNSDSADLH